MTFSDNLSYRAFAAGALIQQIEDWGRYHSEEADKYRAGEKQSKFATKRMEALLALPDPYMLLTSHTVLHDMAGIDPDKIRKFLIKNDPKTLLRQIRLLKGMYYKKAARA